MKISRIYLLLFMNFVAAVVDYYRECYASFSLCLITNTRDDSHDSNSKYRLTWFSAVNWCKNHSSSLAIITNETVQSAVEAFIKDRSSKLMNSYVLINGYRYDLSTWKWVNGRNSSILPSVSYNTSRYVYLVVSSDTRYNYLRDGFPYWKMKFICSYVTHNASCSYGFQQLGSRCYKFHESEATWFAARNICLKDKSDLATFEDGISSVTSESIEQFWIGLRKERWDWFKDQTNYGEIKYSNWDDENPHSAGGDCLCLNARTGRWTNCDCLRTYRYICIQDYVSGLKSNVTTTQTTRIITTTTTQIARTTTKLKKKTTTPKFGDSTSQFHSTPNRTLDDDFRSEMSGDSAVAVESEHSDFLPFVGIGIACLLIIIVVIVVVVFMKSRRSRSDDHEPTHGNPPPPMTYKEDAPSTVYAAVIPNTNDQVYSASDKNSNQTVYAELDLESRRSIGPTQRVSVKVRFTSEETPSQAVYAEVNQVSHENMNEKAEGPSVYDNYNQLMMDSVYANSAQTKV